MSLLSKLFGSRAKPAPTGYPPEVYKDFIITPTPMPDGPRFRLSARIEKDIDGLRKSHLLVRADTIDDETTAVASSVAKAKRMIDEQGDRLFG